MVVLVTVQKNSEISKIPNPSLTASETSKIRISGDAAIEIECNLHYNKL